MPVVSPILPICVEQATMTLPVGECLHITIALQILMHQKVAELGNTPPIYMKYMYHAWCLYVQIYVYIYCYPRHNLIGIGGSVTFPYTCITDTQITLILLASTG